MIDFHTHILPGIDDGSRDINMTKDMLLMEKEQGTDLIIATPHFYAHRTRVEEFLMRREHSLAKVMELKSETPGLPEIKAGAEVYYFEGIGRAEHTRQLCIEWTDLILLELPFRPWDRSVITDIKNLINRQHLRVILAHVERYMSLQKDRKLYEEVLNLPVTIQVNAGSFLEAGFFKSRHLLSIIKDSTRPVIMGSDCHNTSSRKPNLREGLELIQNKLSEETVSAMVDTAESLFR